MYMFRDVEARSHNHCCRGKAITPILYSITFQKSQTGHSWQYGACRITKATNTHSGNVILIAFLLNSGYANASQCCVVRTSVLYLRKKTVMIMLKRVVARATVMIMLKIVVARATNDYAENSNRRGDCNDYAQNNSGSDDCNNYAENNNHPGDCNDYAENSSRPGCVQPWLCAPTTLPSNR